MEPVVGKAGTGVYVVDNEYRIAYFNEVLEHFYPDLQLGSPCYREPVSYTHLCWTPPPWISTTATATRCST